MPEERPEVLCVGRSQAGEWVTMKCTVGYMPLRFNQFPEWEYHDDMIGGKPK